MELKEILNSVNIENNIATLNIYSDIVSSEWNCCTDDDVYPEFVSQFLETVNDKELHVHINSGGGSAFAGVAIYNLLKRRNGKTITYVDCLAASAASLIALAGDEMIMPAGSMLMIHKPWSYVVGNSDELRKEADNLDKICESFSEIYKENLKNADDYEKVMEMVAKETWLKVSDCTELFTNAKADNTLKACACIKSEILSRYKLPAELKVTDKIPTEPNDNDEIERMKMELEIEEELMMLN